MPHLAKNGAEFSDSGPGASNDSYTTARVALFAVVSSIEIFKVVFSYPRLICFITCLSSSQSYILFYL